MMNCSELVEVVTDYLEGTLPEADRARFEDHLKECPHCVEYLAQMRRTLEAVGRIPEETLSGPVQKQLLETFRQWKRNKTDS